MFILSTWMDTSLLWANLTMEDENCLAVSMAAPIRGATRLTTTILLPRKTQTDTDRVWIKDVVNLRRPHTKTWRMRPSLEIIIFNRELFVKASWDAWPILCFCCGAPLKQQLLKAQTKQTGCTSYEYHVSCLLIIRTTTTPQCPYETLVGSSKEICCKLLWYVYYHSCLFSLWATHSRCQSDIPFLRLSNNTPCTV